VNAAERVIRRVDTFQQDHRPAAFGFGVIKKFGDDRGGSLAALITYYGFLAVFPLLLLLTTVLGFLMDKNSHARQTILTSALRDFPIVGDQLAKSVHPLKGSPVGLIVGLLGLVWGSMGISQAAQYAMAEIWNIPGEHRPGFFPRLVRSLMLLGVLALGVVLTAAIVSLGAWAPLGGFGRVLVPLVSVALNVSLFVLGFRVLTPAIATRDLLPGAIVGGVGWSILQVVGALLVGHNLRHASQVYGYFASVLGLVSWLYLSAQLALYASEINVVRARRLWPRSIVQPPLTEADKRTLDNIAEQGKRRPEQEVESVWNAS
jgi:YihY family inner membrane protein